MRYIELPVQYSTSTCTRQHEYAATAVYILHVHRSREHSAYNTLASDETRGKVEIQYKAEWCNGTTSVKMKTHPQKSGAGRQARHCRMSVMSVRCSERLRHCSQILIYNTVSSCHSNAVRIYTTLLSTLRLQYILIPRKVSGSSRRERSV